MEKKRFQSIDIMKAFAMLAVILVHYNQSFYNAIPILIFFQMGCQLFFVLSGFGVAASLSKNLSENNLKSTAKNFWLKRIQSIAIPYWFMIIIVYLINTVTLKFYGSALNFGYNRNIFDILCNMLLIHGLVPSANNNVMPGGWYIGTTFLLYLIAPFVFVRFKKARNPKLLCAVSSLISISLLVILSLIFPNSENMLLGNNSFGYFSVLTQFPCFCMGMLLYFIINTRPLTTAKAISSFAASILTLGIAFLLFISHFTKYSYILSVSAVGLASFFILYSMIYYEINHNSCNCFKSLTKVSSKTLYIYLVHPFFAWTFTKVIKKLLFSLGVNADSYLVMLILLPFVIGFSYLFACILKLIIAKIMTLVHKIKLT